MTPTARQDALTRYLGGQPMPNVSLHELAVRHAAMRFRDWALNASDAEIAQRMREIAVDPDEPRTATDAQTAQAIAVALAERLGWLEAWRNRLAALGIGS
jgi:hypothetical protein